MRPVDRCAQRLLTAHCGAGAAGEQFEPVMQAIENLVERQRPYSRGGELDGKRHAVEAPADLRDRLGVAVVDGEIWPGMASAVAEQLDRLVSERQRRNLPDHLTADHEGLTTGRQDGHSWGGCQQIVDERGTGFEQVFAV